jgi:hypothetical protein
MSEWAARLLFPPEKPRADLDEFVQQVNNENVEYLSFKKEFDERKETKPSFEQVGQDRILEEANKNIKVLKSLETIIYERSQSFSALLAAQAKYKGPFDNFQYCEGTIRQSLDALFVFLEQDLQQARQQQLFGELKKALQLVRSDTQKRLADYQREVHIAEKEVISAEKRLTKSREVFEKSVDARQK